MLEPTAMLKSPFAVSPAVPASRSYNCKVSSHSAAGTYEVTLDQGINSAECVATLSSEGVDASAAVTHTSDTVKVIKTYLAGVLSDAVNFSVVFYRLPAGHP